MSGSKIIASAHYVPENIVTNDELAAFMPTNDAWIQSHTGIQTRHISLQGENTSDLATKAAQMALAKSDLTAADLDLIIVSTITPDALTPATAAIVQRNLQATNAWAYDISTACAGFVFAMSTADKFLQTGQYQHALIISAEVNSKMMDFTDRTSTVFFGDGAGAFIVSRTTDEDGQVKAEQLRTDGDADVIHSGFVAPLTHLSADNYPEVNAFFQDGRPVFEFATTTVPTHMKAFLADNSLTADDVDYFILHQANLRIIEAIAEHLAQPMTKFRTNVTYYGNTSSAGIAMALDELRSEVDLTGKRVMLTGFGAGLSYGSLILEF
ncbi:MAG TPA: beta-ketoacyl-ACP synthase III [Lactobacillaceae bacterium]|jgi:3-oxoacyl-[acyl-carrier-protein] synthase-3